MEISSTSPEDPCAPAFLDLRLNIDGLEEVTQSTNCKPLWYRERVYLDGVKSREQGKLQTRNCIGEDGFHAVFVHLYGKSFVSELNGRKYLLFTICQVEIQFRLLFSCIELIVPSEYHTSTLLALQVAKYSNKY